MTASNVYSFMKLTVTLLDKAWVEYFNRPKKLCDFTQIFITILKHSRLFTVLIFRDAHNGIMRKVAIPSLIQKGRDLWKLLVMRSAGFRHLTQRTVEIPFRCFRTTSQSNLEGSWAAWPLKMGPIGCPEKSIPKSRKVRVEIILPLYLKCEHR